MPIFKVNNTFVNTKQIQVAGDLVDKDDLALKLSHFGFYIRFRTGHTIYANKIDCVELLNWLERKARKGKVKKKLRPDKESSLKS